MIAIPADKIAEAVISNIAATDRVKGSRVVNKLISSCYLIVIGFIVISNSRCDRIRLLFPFQIPLASCSLNICNSLINVCLLKISRK